ncbi:MAG: hypothetical protein HDR29_00620 [Lachnospiraceae bacterium]|nr:hypothetical protein [Lachnospiraceae bacterium]
MKKYFSRKYLKRKLALLLAVSMVFTTNVFGLDTVSAETVESTTESEDAAVQNDNDTALEEGEDSADINEESGSLPDNEDENSPVENEEPLQNVDDGEELLAGMSENGEDEEEAAYCVLKLNDENSLKAVMDDQDLLWEEGGYGDQWEETVSLNTFLASNGMEYVVLQQLAQNSDKSENKILELPVNIKGALLVNDWDDEADAPVNWQLNKLSIKGAATSVYLYNLVIDTDENEKLTIDFSAAENNNSKVVLNHNVVNAQIYCASTAGKICFIEDNIIKGYSVMCTTDFSKEYDYVDLLINGEAGLSFEEITGDTDVSIVFNGYPGNTESLPRFNKKIDLGVGTDTDDNGDEIEYNRGIGLRFWQHKNNPFWLDESIEEGGDWWKPGEESALKLEAGTQVAYFAGRKLIGENVHCAAKNAEGADVYLNSVTGRLEDGDDEERAAYGVLKLENKAVFDGLMEDDSPLWDEESEEYYGDLWDETDYLDEYLARDGMEYVVIQATKTSHNSENKSLVLPANIKGILLINDWDNDEQVEWQLNELNIAGAETCVFLSGNIIDTVGNEKFTIDFSAEGTNASEVICKNIVVNAQINCDSTAGKICFIENNILKGYSVKCKTEFHENGNLLINGEAGLSFEEITGDTNAQIIFNGYPESPESLPHFNKEINLGKDINDEGEEYDRGIGIGFWEYNELPFWLDKSKEDNWWSEGEKSALDLEAGTQVAYFAGLTENERALIGHNVYYNTYNEENNLHINSYTGKLEEDNAEWEGLAYRVLKLDGKTVFDTIIESNEIPWDDERWDATETDCLDNYLARDGMEYVIIQATRALHNSENKSLELPVNIKGVLLISEHYEEDQEYHVAAWQLNTIKAEGSKEIHIFDAGMDPMNNESEDSDVEPENPGLKIETTAADVNVVIENSEIMGDLSLSGIADIKFIDSKVFGALDLGSNKPTVSLEGMIVADNLYGYSALKINGDTTFIVRYHGEVVIENCEFIKTNGEGEGQGVTLIYNGYPKDASVLPVFKDNIVTPQNFGINLRFVEQSNEFFWEEEDWFDNVPDESLPAGTQIAVADIPGEKYEGLPLDYYTKEVENPDNTIHTELIRDDEGRVLIKQTDSKSGKQIVGFALSVNSEKEYDGKAFEISEDSVFNNCGYAGDVELAWESKDGTSLEEAPKDAGEYLLKASVPEGTEEYEGSNKIPVVITARTVTVSVRPHATETRTAPVAYDIIWTGFANGDTYVKQAEVEAGAETTDETGKYYILSIKGGEVSSNYTIAHGEPVRVTIIEDTKPCINSVLFPKKKAEYSAIYTGEQIRPVMVVAYNYKDDKGREKTQKLKLNVDYTVTYTNNINVGTNTAQVTVNGIGEYTGEINKEFSITPKSIKKVTLSPVGDIIYGDEPAVTVMDGNYELVEGEDYEIVLSSEGSETADTQSELKVKGIGNYNEESKKKVKFNILKTSTEIKSIDSEGVTVEFKKPDKVYTYNGKAQKPAVVVKDGGVKVPASQYKVLYTNNVNAGTQKAIVKVVGVSKKGKGYYGIASTELKFDIKQKDLSKIKASIKGTIPKAGTIEDIKKAVDEALTVTDGKHVLSEDEYTVDYGNITKTDDIVIGTKYLITLTATADGNYVENSKKVVNIKFGQLNLASKTAAVSVKIKDAANNKVEVKYNGTVLTEGTDYTAQVKPDKNKTTYTVTIKAVKKAAYKGKKVVKNLTVESEE